jgi:hypothetical protein
LITDQYAAYNAVLDAKVYPQRRSAVCAAHARRRSLPGRFARILHIGRRRREKESNDNRGK